MGGLSPSRSTQLYPSDHAASWTYHHRRVDEPLSRVHGPSSASHRRAQLRRRCPTLQSASWFGHLWHLLGLSVSLRGCFNLLSSVLSFWQQWRRHLQLLHRLLRHHQVLWHGSASVCPRASSCTGSCCKHHFGCRCPSVRQARSARRPSPTVAGSAGTEAPHAARKAGLRASVDPGQCRDSWTRLHAHNRGPLPHGWRPARLRCRRHPQTALPGSRSHLLEETTTMYNAATALTILMEPVGKPVGSLQSQIWTEYSGTVHLKLTYPLHTGKRF